MIVGKIEQLLLVLLVAVPSHSFVVRSPSAVSFENRKIGAPTTTSLTSTRTDEAGGAASLIKSEDPRSQLASAFLELGENDQYDAIMRKLSPK